jgi:predicted nucleotidyltransferase component of viral defense system
MTKTTKRTPESVLARLRHLAQTTYPNLPANAMLSLYAQQGLLARLERSPHRDRFVLKGALSLFARYRHVARPTEDIDLAAEGLPNTPESVGEIMRDLAMIEYPDGLVFDAASVRTRIIHAEADYPGVNITLRATLGKARVDLHVDVSFGNVITPGPVTLEFPALLVSPAIHVRAYPLETVITEKFAALVEIGEATTRMKDLYDLQTVLTTEAFEASLTRLALERSFAQRETPLADLPFTLGDAFAQSELLIERWGTYLRRTRLNAPNFEVVMGTLRAFFAPLLLEGREDGIWLPERRHWQDRDRNAASSKRVDQGG